MDVNKKDLAENPLAHQNIRIEISRFTQRSSKGTHSSARGWVLDDWVSIQIVYCTSG